MNVNGVCGSDVGDGGHHGRTYRSDLKNVPSEDGSESASRKSVSLSLCPWMSEIGAMRKAPNAPICEIDSSGGGDSKSHEISKSYASDRFLMTLYV